MKKYKTVWLMASVSLLAVAACATLPQYDYEFCGEETAINPCPDNALDNADIEIEGM